MGHKVPHRIDILCDDGFQPAGLEEPGQGTVPGVWLGIPHLGVALDLTAPVHRSLTPAGAPLDGLKPAGEGPFRQSPRGGRLSLRSASKIDKKMTHDVRGTRYRIAGPAEDGRLVHVVCRFKEVGSLIIITVYSGRGAQ